MIVELDHRLFVAQDYALINPMQVSLDQRSDLETVSLLPKCLERHARLMPLLVELKSLPQSRRLDLLEHAEWWSGNYDMPLFSALLAGAVDMQKLQMHLVRNMLLRRSGAAGAWLRFHDPRVFRHLRWMLDDEQMARLMGPVAAWTWYDPLSGQWQAHERTVAASSQRLTLTQEQWLALDQLEALNRCLRDLAEELPAPAGDDVARQLVEGLKNAQRQGLHEAADRGLYARQCLRHGADFHLCDDMRERLHRARKGEISYVAACMDMEPGLLRENG
ncbi:DUF4123 domain-containing protein [Luteimonas sp. A277]